MTLQLEVIGLVVADMGKSLAFYRRLGVKVPDGADAGGFVSQFGGPLALVSEKTAFTG